MRVRTAKYIHELEFLLHSFIQTRYETWQKQKHKLSNPSTPMHTLSLSLSLRFLNPLVFSHTHMHGLTEPLIIPHAHANSLFSLLLSLSLQNYPCVFWVTLSFVKWRESDDDGIDDAVMTNGSSYIKPTTQIFLYHVFSINLFLSSIKIRECIWLLIVYLFATDFYRSKNTFHIQ